VTEFLGTTATECTGCAAGRHRFGGDGRDGRSGEWARWR